MLNTKARTIHPKQTKKQKQSAKGPLKMKCPYCGNQMHLRSADGIYQENPDKKKLYVCTQYPKCDTYVRLVDNTYQPIGTPANGSLRRLRDDAHKAFDKLWKQGYMSRDEAYQWMSIVSGLPRDYAHIGNFREAMCQLVINESVRFIEARRKIERTDRYRKVSNL